MVLLTYIMIMGFMNLDELLEEYDGQAVDSEAHCILLIPASIP